MKKRVLSLVLVCLLAVGLASNALAVTFTDLGNHWAAPYILDMAEKGIFEGDAAGTVRPEGKVTNMEALTMAARMALPNKTTRDQFWADRARELTAMFPDQPSDWWFFREAATCLELGIIDHDDLARLVLTQETTKAEYAKYVVRAMGLDDLTYGVSRTSLPFADDLEIPSSLWPYVSLLHNYGVITGSEHAGEAGKLYFDPSNSLKRGECATFLSRALEQMELRNISVEIPRFTKYAWTGGYIQSVKINDDGSARLLTLVPPFGDAVTVTLPDGTPVYRSNQPVGVVALQEGAFARVCYGEDGVTPSSVRVTPKDLLKSVTGACASLTANEIKVAGVTYTIDRFTQVSAGAKTGDATVIDFDAAYTDATLTADRSGRVIHLTLSGGTRQVSGILTDVDTVSTAAGSMTAITVTSYGGKTTVYQVPASATVTVDGSAGELKEFLEGRQVTLRVSEEDLTELHSVAVNSADTYIQGIFKATDLKADPKKVEITKTGETKKTPCVMGENATVLYSEAAAELSAIPANVFVTARVEGGNIITWLAAYPSYETVSGTLQALNFKADGATLQLAPKTGGPAVNFTVPLTKLTALKITLDGKTAQVSQLRAGQQMAVTLLYNEVSQLDAISQEANLTGTLQAVNFKLDGSADLTVAFADGSSATYTANSATTVTVDGTASSLDTLKPKGQAVSLLTEGSVVLELKVTGAAATQTKTELTGTVVYVDTSAKTISLLVDDKLQSVSYTSASIPVMDNAAANPGLISVSRLKALDTIVVYGNYNDKGVFVAASIVRKGTAG